MRSGVPGAVDGFWMRAGVRWGAQSNARFAQACGPEAAVNVGFYAHPGCLANAGRFGFLSFAPATGSHNNPKP